MTLNSPRRDFLKGSLALAGTVATSNLVLAQGGATIAETSHGKVRGRFEDGLLVFRGIPYGGDTSGRNRFMPPTPVAAWAGTRDCTDWGPIAPKPVSDTPPGDYGRMVGWNNYRGGLSEDCLNLNIWTPAIRGQAKRAVMVTIHGGGFTTGSGNLVALEGARAARAGDVVVVTINHRLGALGYTDLSALGGGDFASSGVVGMLDLVQALQWVQGNIANFGGDPDTVMISGQSGGGGKCSILMAMPSAKGLFQRCAIQSGSTLRLPHHDVGQRNAETLLSKLGLAKNEIARLQALPFDQVTAAQSGSGPTVDGIAVPRDPFDPDAPAVSAAVPMIIGTCLEDSGLSMTDWDIDPAGLTAWTETQVPGKSEVVLAAYRKIYPDKRPFLIKAMIATDRNLRRNAVTQAERKNALGGGKAFLYRWDWPTPAQGGKFGAVHGTDLSMSFSNPDTDVGMNTPSARRMATRIGAAYIAFAKTGNPDNAAIPHWPAYDPQTRATMIFDDSTRVENDPHHDLRLMWDRLSAA